jgi:nitrile hydratase accessory protein
LSGLPPLPGPLRDEAGPVFREPWEAHAFAIAVKLHERGVFTWPEWAEALGREISAARERGDPDDGGEYYRHWLAALEALVARKGVGTATELARVRLAWDHAALRTPHGAPVELTDADYPEAG